MVVVMLLGEYGNGDGGGDDDGDGGGDVDNDDGGGAYNE